MKIRLFITAVVAILCISGTVMACTNHDQPICTPGQIDKGDIAVDGECVSPSPTPEPVPVPEPAPTPIPVPQPVPQPAPAPTPPPVVKITTPVFEGK